MSTKGDLTNRAYKQLRISGKTRLPTGGESGDAMDRLESLMQELYGRSICVDYLFEEEPDLATPHNVPRKYWYAIEVLLAIRMAPDFNKEPPLFLQAQYTEQWSFLASSTAKVRETNYPTRMPIGSGNTLKYNRYQRFFRNADEVPLNCESVTMAVDDINDFEESFFAYLKDGEVISSFTIESDDGLFLVSSSNDDTVVQYQVRADGNDGEKSDTFLQVRIVVTTDAGRKETRLRNFEIIDTEL